MAQFKECRHVMPSGLNCKSPAMRGSRFCYFHGRASRPARPILPIEARLDMAPVLGSSEILGALNQVIQALAANQLSPRRAAVLLQAVQMASSHELSHSIEPGTGFDSQLRQASLSGPNRMKK